MSGRAVLRGALRSPGPWVALAAAAGAAVVLLAPAELGEQRLRLPPALVALAGIAVALAVLWFGFLRPLGRAARVLAAESRLALEAGPATRFEPDRHALLPDIAAAIAGMIAALRAAEEDAALRIGGATQHAAENQAQLAAVLRDLDLGIVICNSSHRILLYNRAALPLLVGAGEVGLGRPIFNLLAPAPIEHALDLLRHLAAGGAPGREPVAFTGATTDGGKLLQGRAALVVDAADQAKGYVLTLQDAAREPEAAYQRNLQLRAAVVGMRGALGNLRAAAEIMALHPDMPPERRNVLQQVVVEESQSLSGRIETLDRDLGASMVAHWSLADVHSVDLINGVARRLADRGGPPLTMVGMPLWLRVETFSMTLLLTGLIERLAAETGAQAFDMEALLADRRIYLELSWGAPPPPATLLESWAAEPIGGKGGSTMREILDRHGSMLWTTLDRRGHGRVRLPLPWPLNPDILRSQTTSAPPRPEFYDFDLLRRLPDADQASLDLRALNYVALDTETTGLQPGQGDEIIAVGAVRIVNGRILTGETFDRLVNPDRPIPVESIRFHGITDAMVADAPPIQVMLPQVRQFVGGAVLVGHNIGFDLRFIQLKEAESGVAFDNAALDTLILARFLWPELERPSLDAIAERLGIAIPHRHRALGDAMATAAIFLKMLDVLEARGIRTFEALARESNMLGEIRAQARVF